MTHISKGVDDFIKKNIKATFAFWLVVLNSWRQSHIGVRGGIMFIIVQKSCFYLYHPKKWF